MKTGLYISGAAHTGLIAWILFGGLFLRAEDPVTFENTQVSLLTSEEFRALSDAAEPSEVDPSTTPPETLEPETPDAPTPPQEPIVPDQPSVEPQPTEPQIVPLAPIAPEASPRPSARVSSQPNITDTPDATEDLITQEATETVDAPEPEPEITPEVEDTTAPQDASDTLQAEAEAPPASAPATSRRPPSRPARPEPTETVAETAPETVPESSQNADIMAALNEANSADTATQTQSVPSGPPLSSGETDALRISVSRCWNVGTLSSEALRTTVVVSVNMARDGKPDAGSIRLVSSNGGSQASATQAYEAARRAIIRCGSQGFDLPAEKYDHWKEIEITFDPEKMRNR